MVRYYHVLIVGDSRMRHLQSYLNDTSFNIYFTVVTLPGATLRRIMHEAIEIVRCSRPYQLIIIAGGINDLTVLHRHPTRHVFPRTRVVPNLINHILHEMHYCIDGISHHTNTPVALAMLSGINLAAYSPRYFDLMYILQPYIDRAIVEINHRVRGINRMNNLHSPDLSSAVHHCAGRGGRYRTHYHQLHDGLHPGGPLRLIWARNIIAFCARFFPDISHIQVRI